VQAVWGVEQKTLPFAATSANTSPAPDCTNGPVTPTPTDAGKYAATWLGSKLTNGYLTTGTSPDYSLTAQAVIAFAASGTNATAATSALNYLTSHAASAINDPHGNVSPGAVGYLALAAHATGGSMTSFGGVDLLAALANSRRALPTVTKKPVVTPVKTPASPTPAPPVIGGNTTTPTLPTTGIPAHVLAGIGVDFVFVGGLILLAGRRRRTAGT
jgi:LPXTG-motif cell wall-anchored protein